MHLAWAKGGGADLLSIEGDALVLRSSSPAPPGARLDATLATGEAVKLKSHGTHREPDGTFTLRARLLDAPRALRDRLASLSPADR